MHLIIEPSDLIKLCVPLFLHDALHLYTKVEVFHGTNPALLLLPDQGSLMRPKVPVVLTGRVYHPAYDIRLFLFPGLLFSYSLGFLFFD